MNKLTSTLLNFIFSLIFALYNCIMGLFLNSYWFISLGAYYSLLAIMRVVVILFSKKDTKYEIIIMKFSGFMLFIMAIILSVIVYMTIVYTVSDKYNEIVMIAIALYAFTKITYAIIEFVKSKNGNSISSKTLKSISVTDGVVTIYSLQKSMLVTFEGLTQKEIVIFNLLSGIGMCLIVILIGCNLILETEYRNNKRKMKKDKN